MRAYKIYRIYLTFIAFSTMLTNHTFTDYFGTTVLFINSEFPLLTNSSFSQFKK